MELKTISVYVDERKKFDEEVNYLLSKGWQLRDLQVIPHTNSNFNRLVAFLQK